MKCFVFFLVLLPQMLFAQKRTIKIIDRQTNLPVAYATVKVLHTSQGDISSAKGVIELPIADNDSVLISSVGYGRKIFLGQYVKDTIFLDPIPKLMDEVTVKQKRFIKTILLGNGVDLLNKKIKCNFHSNTNISETDCVPWGPADQKEEFAEKLDLPSSKNTYIIRKIFIPTKTVGCPGSLLLHIYDMDSLTGYPGEELFTRFIDIEKTKNKKDKIVVDMAAEIIQLQKTSSFFISVGWPPDAAGGKCKSLMVLPRFGKENTYYRSLTSITYPWFQFGRIRLTIKGEEVRLSTAYAVELAEMK